MFSIHLLVISFAWVVLEGEGGDTWIVSLGGFFDLFTWVVLGEGGRNTLGSVSLGRFSVGVQLRGLMLSGISSSLKSLPKFEVWTLNSIAWRYLKGGECLISYKPSPASLYYKKSLFCFNPPRGKIQICSPVFSRTPNISINILGMLITCAIGKSRGHWLKEHTGCNNFPNCTYLRLPQFSLLPPLLPPRMSSNVPIEHSILHIPLLHLHIQDHDNIQN